MLSTTTTTKKLKDKVEASLRDDWFNVLHDLDRETWGSQDAYVAAHIDGPKSCSVRRAAEIIHSWHLIAGEKSSRAQIRRRIEAGLDSARFAGRRGFSVGYGDGTNTASGFQSTRPVGYDAYDFQDLLALALD